MAHTAKKENKRSGVLICGAYGMSNAGDEAVLDALLAEMRSIDPTMPITVLSRTPAETAAKHGVPAIHMFDVFAFLRCMRKCRLYINGGGSLMQDVTSSRSLWYYLYTLMAAKHRGCKVMMYGCGVGPVGKKPNRRLMAWIINRYVDAITLREEHSFGVLRELGVDRPRMAVASDPALFLKKAEASAIDALLEKTGLDKDGDYFCLCVRRWPQIREKTAIFAAAANYARETYGLEPVLLSINPKQDDAISAPLAKLCGAKCLSVGEDMSVEEVIGFISRMKAVMAMRLHALVFSASQSVPLIGISYDPKVTAFLEYISQTNYLNYEDVSTADRLCALVDKAMLADTKALEEATEKIMAIERRNTDMARQLLEEEV